MSYDKNGTAHVAGSRSTELDMDYGGFGARQMEDGWFTGSLDCGDEPSVPPQETVNERTIESALVTERHRTDSLFFADYTDSPSGKGTGPTEWAEPDASESAGRFSGWFSQGDLSSVHPEDSVEDTAAGAEPDAIAVERFDEIGYFTPAQEARARAAELARSRKPRSKPGSLFTAGLPARSGADAEAADEDGVVRISGHAGADEADNRQRIQVLDQPAGGAAFLFGGAPPAQS
jgi:hypothetical protein